MPHKAPGTLPGFISLADAQEAIGTQWRPRKCPMCGKRFRLNCPEEDWGYYSHSRCLCSYRCMRDWERSFESKAAAQALDRTLVAEIQRLYDGGMRQVDIAKRLGLAIWTVRRYAVVERS